MKPVFDSRNRRIRGLWINPKKNTYYLQGRFGGRYPRKVLLDGATNLTEAQIAMKRLSVQQADNDLPVLGKTPTLEWCIDEYLLNWPAHKKASTKASEARHLNLWKKFIGHLRIADITPAHIDTFVNQMEARKLTGATCDISVTFLNNVLNRAMRIHRLIKNLPTACYMTRGKPPRKKPLITMASIQAILNEALKMRDGKLFVLYVRLLYTSGMREQEALTLKWADIDWAGNQLHLGTETKNDEGRVVDFNPTMEAVLVELKSLTSKTSQWLFPMSERTKRRINRSRQRRAMKSGKSEWVKATGDVRAKNFHSIMATCRKHANLPTFAFHDLRRFFISWCIMSGVDFMTIARWVGHKDGGVLIGRVYGHVANDYRRKMANKLQFGKIAEDSTTVTTTPAHPTDSQCGITILESDRAVS
jgi:integrase